MSRLESVLEEARKLAPEERRQLAARLLEEGDTSHAARQDERLEVMRAAAGDDLFLADLTGHDGRFPARRRRRAARMSIERWSVWRANLDPVVGSEQGLTRPVLVISQTALNDILPVVNVLPITSRKASPGCGYRPGIIWGATPRMAYA